MAYRRPAVEVIQEFQALTPAFVLPTLPACVIGPAYQIEDDGDAGAYDGTETAYSYPNLYSGATPDIAELDSEELESTQKPIVVTLSNAYIKLGNATDGDTTSGDQTFTAAAGSPFSVVPSSMGTTKYYVEITETGHPDIGKHLITSKTSDTEVELADELTSTATGVDFNILKLDTEIEYTRSTFSDMGITPTTSSVTIPANLPSDPDSSTSDPVSEADTVYISYRALRPDLADSLDVYTDLDSLEAVFGTGNVTPENPYAYGTNAALNNTTTQIYATGLRATYLTDEAQAYQTALEFLESEDVYALVVLTQNTAVHQILSTHVTNQSVSSVGRERIGVINRKLLTYSIIVPSSGVGTVTSAGTNNGTSPAHDNTTFKDPTNGNFIGDSVSVGSYLEISGYTAVEGTVRGPTTSDGADSITSATKTIELTGGSFTSADVGRTLRIASSASGNDGDYTIATIVDTRTVTVTETVPSDESGGSYTGTVVEKTPSTSQAAYITGTRHYISAINSNTTLTLQSDPTNGFYGTLEDVVYRVTEDLTKDEEASFIAGYSSSFANRRLVNVWPDTCYRSVGGVDTELPGFYFGCDIVGMIAGLPSQQGLTNLSLTGPTGRKNSGDRFSDTQLNTIAGGGTLVVDQDVTDAPLYVRHQLTTNTSTIQFQELSVTKNVDLIARFFRVLYKPYIGKYNITDALFDMLKSISVSGVEFLKNQKAPRAGAVLRDGSLKSIGESTSQPDIVIIKIRANIPYPLNNIIVTLLV